MYGKIHMSTTAEIQRNRRNFVVSLQEEARKDPYFKPSLKHFQRKMLMFLYFTQHIPTARNTSLCMKILITQAKYIIEMNL